MKLSFHGAAGEVTGACTLLETETEKILVDCGLFQGGEEHEQQNFIEFKFKPQALSAVIVTHAHLDHIGRLPLLVRAGYQGPIYATPATVELARFVLEDALMVMEEDNRRYDKPMLYDHTEVAATLQQFKAVDYGESARLKNSANSLSFKFYEAGHIFGSAFVELQAASRSMVFSGDIGNTDVPILQDTAVLPPGVEAVICESTYGGRVHEVKTNVDREKIIARMITDALQRGGVLMIPAFALERTQQLLYVLNDLIDRRRVLPRVPIFLDSPLAIKATEIYRDFPQYYNQAAKKLYQTDDDLFAFPGLTICETIEQSKKINHVPGAKIIIAGAGMMNGGRIIHHALRYLSDSSSTLLFVGYQAKGTLGRQILEGVSQVKIMKERVPVNCHIQALGALSAHADQNKLLDWLGGGETLPKKVYFNHGEPDQAGAIAKRVKEDWEVEAIVATSGLTVEI